MTSIGRGRGWARPAEKETVLRRPGQPSSPKTSELDELVEKIYDDVCIEESTPSNTVTELATLMESLAESQSPEKLGERLSKQALEDRCFVIKIMQLYKKEYRKILENKVNVTSKIKKILMQSMQECYEKKEEWYKDNPAQLANLVWGLGITIEVMASESLVRHMGSALINCCSLLLASATEEDTETVAIQVYLHGKRIKAIFPSAGKSLDASLTLGLDDIVHKARTILVNRNVSARTRALLLLIIDLANHDYEPLTGDIQVFYASILGSSRVQQENDSQFKTSRGFDSECYLYGILTKGMKRPKNEIQAVQQPTHVAHEPARNKLPQPPPPQPQQQQVPKINRGPNGSGSSGPFPRAIRGSGASEILKEHKNDKRSPRAHKEKLTDEQVWSAKQNTGSKVWGHDDRFDNDY